MSSDDFVNLNNFGSLLIDQEEKERVSDLLSRKRLFRFSDTKGESENFAFEQELAQIFHTQGAVTVSSGTAALRCAFHAAGIRPGDRVLVSAYTFIAPINVIIGCAAIPEPVDLDENLQMNIDDLVSRMKRQKIKAIVPVHIAGRAQDIRQLVELANKKNILIIEDACQAFSAHFQGSYAGTIGHLGTISFQENKLITCGEGGAVFAKDKEIMSIARRFSDHGAYREDTGIPNWDHETASFGDNLRMTELQAAILRVQLKRLPIMIKKQRNARDFIEQEIQSCRYRIIKPTDLSGDTGQALLLYIKDINMVKVLINTAQKKRILLRHIWPKVYYQYKVFDKLGLTPKKMGIRPCVQAEKLAPRLLCLPVPPTLTDSDVHYIADTLKQILELK